ncbi:hypothetical protein DFH06DRAFT_1345099 [Mycena polygramma]|nr:hypothetical protein DFH06DRAFT_1345099 [Mycena polygramma]
MSSPTHTGPRIPRCVPEYCPHPGHSYSKEQHSADPACRFFAVLRGGLPAIYTSMDQVNQSLKGFEGGLWVQAPTWDEIIEIWDKDCLDHHSHPVDLTTPTPPSSPSELSTPLPPSRSPPLSPAIRQERAAARLEAAADAAEAAARRIGRDADRIFGLAEEAAGAVSRIGRHSERAFGFLQKAMGEARHIGEEADRVLEIMAATGVTVQGMSPLLGFAAARDELECPSDDCARADAVTTSFDALTMDARAATWVKSQRAYANK